MSVIPAGIEGLDLTICKLMLTEVQDRNKAGDYIMRPRTYKEIGLILGMTESAVNKRMVRLRKRMRTERGAAKDRGEAHREVK